MGINRAVYAPKAWQQNEARLSVCRILSLGFSSAAAESAENGAQQPSSTLARTAVHCSQRAIKVFLHAASAAVLFVGDGGGGAPPQRQVDDGNGQSQQQQRRRRRQAHMRRAPQRTGGAEERFIARGAACSHLHFSRTSAPSKTPLQSLAVRHGAADAAPMADAARAN
jgi:hypothetical protein